MLTIARSRLGADHPALHWIEDAAETFDYGEASYAMVIAAESFHWLDWQVVVPKVAQALSPGGLLAIIERRPAGPPVPWADELLALVKRYSTMKDYVELDLIEELERRSLFESRQRVVTRPMPFSQSIDDYCLAHHSTSSLSIEVMGAASAKAFDNELKRIVQSFAVTDGRITRQIAAHITLGQPLTSAADLKFSFG